MEVSLLVSIINLATSIIAFVVGSLPNIFQIENKPNITSVEYICLVIFICSCIVFLVSLLIYFAGKKKQTDKITTIHIFSNDADKSKTEKLWLFTIICSFILLLVSLLICVFGITYNKTITNNGASIDDILFSSTISDAGDSSSDENTKYINVSLDANGGSVGVNEINVEYGGAYQKLPTPEREHFTFNGWYTDVKGGDSVTNYTIVELPYDHTLYAHWERYEAEVPNVVNKSYDEAKKELESYGFVVSKKELEHSQAPIGNVTYQSYEAGNYLKLGTVITLDVSNGKKQVTVFLHFNYEDISPDSIEVEYEGKYSKLPTPQRTNYIFEGWYTKAIGGDLVTNDTIVNENIVHSLYAHWKEDKQLKYDVPIRFSFNDCISATLEGSNLNIKVSKDHPAFDNIKSDEIFEWGPYISSTLSSPKKGDYLIQLWIIINSDYTIMSSQIFVYVQDDDSIIQKEELKNNHIDTRFDGQYFYIDCDISNNYINLENLCIQNITYLMPR